MHTAARTHRSWRFGLVLAVIVGMLAIVTVAVTAPTAQAYQAGTDTWSTPTGGSNTSTRTMPGGVAVTLQSTGATTVGAPTTLFARGATASTFYPSTMVSTDSTAEFTVSASSCTPGAACGGLGTLTYSFSQPVTNPVLDFHGFGAVVHSGTSQTDFHAVLDLATPGLSLSKAAGNTSLVVNNGTQISTANDSTATACNSNTPSGFNATAATAGCGSVQVTGTSSQISFNVSIRSVKNATSPASYSLATGSDAVGTTVTLGEDFSDAPASYNGSQAPSHTISDLKLGATVDEDNAQVRNASTSPFAGAGASGDDNSGIDDEDAFTTLSPIVAVAGTPYSLDVPLSGLSKSATLCGWIDFNQNGTFETAERACATPVSGATTARLTWTIPANVATGASYARFRLGYTASQVQSPTGMADSGEVEDYPISIQVAQPALTLTKSPSPATVSAVGQKVTYSFAVTNSGNVSVSSIAVADTQAAPAGALDAAPTCPATTLAPGASTTCTATYTVTQADLNNGTIKDTATATGAPSTGGSVTSNTASATVNVTSAPALTLTKSPSPATVSAVGQKVTYSFAVTNSGNVSVSSLSVTDTQTAPAGALDAAPTCPTTTLAPGASATCTATYTVTQADLDAGTIKDTATATGKSPSGATVTSPAAQAVVTATQAPGLTMVKSASTPAVHGAGDDVTYRFALTNTGNVTLTGLAVSDVQAAPASPLAGPVSCPTTTLAPGASTTCTATYTATQEDIDAGAISDTATATGRTPSGTPVQTTPSTVTVTAQPAPQLSLRKSASPATISQVGGTITYSFAVTNNGNVRLRDLAIADALTAPAGALDGPVSCPVTTLAPGASTTCTATYTVTQADLDHGSVDNTATASGTTPSGAGVTSPPDTATVTVNQAARLALVKTASTASVTAAGDVITYTFKATNTGNVTVDGVAIDDVQAAPAGALDAAPTCDVSTLAPGAVATCTATYVVTQADLDNGTVSDTATAGGKDPNGNPVTSPPSSVTVSTDQRAELSVVKTAAPTQVSAVGQTVTYTFVVTNTGNVTVRGITVNDTQTAPAGRLDAAPTCAATTLAPGASTTCTATYTVTQADLDHGSIHDSATARGTRPTGTVTSPPGEATVDVAQAPAITLVKTADKTTVSAAGAVIAYTFTVTNSGNVTVHGLAVADTQAAPAGSLDAAPVCNVTTLAPGAVTTCTATYTVTRADLDAGTVADTATATAQDPAGQPVVSGPSSATVLADQHAGLTIDKAADVSSVSAVGDTIAYTFTVTNSGNVTVRDLAVTDAQTAPAGDLDADPVCQATSLAAGASTTCTATYTVTQADLDHGSVHDSATAGGTDPSGAKVTSPPDAVTVTAQQTPALTVVKSAAPTSVSAVGDRITYTFVVTNSGNVTVRSLAVNDTQVAPAGSLDAAPVCDVTTLAPGASATCTATYAVGQADLDAGTIADTATATGNTPTGGPVTSPPSSATVEAVRTSGLTLTKAASPTAVDTVGQVVTYTFTVTNTGNVTVRDLAIADVQTAPAGALDAAPVCNVTTLAPGGLATCRATYTVTQDDLDAGSIHDAATASGTDPSGAKVTSPQAEATVTIGQAAALDLVKTADTTEVSAVGDVITYTFTVANTGNLTVHGLAIADTQLAPAGALDAAPVCNATTLAPGAVTACTATYTVTQDDLDAGSVNDTANATGADPSGDPVVSPDSTATVGVTAAPALTVVKSASPTTVSAAGQTITYTFAVSNTGNVTLDRIAILDTQTAPAGNLDAAPVCDATRLLPGTGTTCTATYTVAQADVDHGSVQDSAIATGTDPTGGPVTSPSSQATVEVTQDAALALTKKASPTTVSAVGDLIGYTFTVTNTGNVTLDDIAITDHQSAPAGNLDADPVCHATALPPGASTTCTATYTVTQADLDAGTVHDTATASGTDPAGDAVTSPEADATVTAAQQPAIGLVKNADVSSVSAVGDVITYTFTISNNGNVTMHDLAVDDTQAAPAGDLDADPVCNVTTLAPGTVTACTATYTVTQADLDAGTINDTATVTGTDPTGTDLTSPPSSATVTTDQAAALALTKAASPATVDTLGQTVTYTFTVTNTGNVTVSSLAVRDRQTAPAGSLDGPVTCPATSLAPGATTSCTGSYTVTQADLDAGSIKDTATASGNGPTGTAITSPPATAIVNVDQTPALDLVKKADVASVSAAGQTIAYTFVVTNTGNVTASDLAVDDTQIAPAGGLDAVPVCAATTLRPGASTTCTATYTATQDDIDAGTINDTATATGHDPAGGDLTSPPSSATVTADQTSALALTKAASPATVDTLGEKVTYTFVVTNTGGVTVHDLAVDDTQTAPAGALDTAPVCDRTTLRPAASATCTATYAVTQADLDAGTIHDTATATGADPNGATVTSRPAEATVTAAQQPAIGLVKSADVASITAVGDVITYTFTVTNSGNVTVRDLVVDDVQAAPAGALDAAPVCAATTLAPTEVTTCTATYTVTQADLDAGSVEDTATATGTPPSGDPVTSPTSTLKIPAGAPYAFEAHKSADPASGSTVVPGQRIGYTLTVHNTGSTTLQAPVTDDLSEVLDDATYGDDARATVGTLTRSGTVLTWNGSIAPGETLTITYSVTMKAYADQGDHEVRNALLVNAPGGSCGTSARASVESGCVTVDHGVPPNAPPNAPHTGGHDYTSGHHQGHPAGDSDTTTGTGGVLPNTGGPRAWIGLGGLLAILVGAVLVAAGRRRRTT